MVQWLGLCALTAQGPGSIPGGETKILHRVAKRKENTSDWCVCGGGEAVLAPLRGKLTQSIIIQKCPHPITKRITSLNLQKRDIVGM